MKKLEIIIKSEKLEDLKNLLMDLGVTGMMLTNIIGVGNEKGYTQIYRGNKYTINMMPKVKVETVVKDDQVECILAAIQAVISTGSVGDGKIFVLPVNDAIRVRTGEKGIEAIM